MGGRGGAGVARTHAHKRVVGSGVEATATAPISCPDRPHAVRPLVPSLLHALSLTWGSWRVRVVSRCGGGGEHRHGWPVGDGWTLRVFKRGGLRDYVHLYRPAGEQCHCSAPLPRQEAALSRGADVVVGTPGRLADTLARGSLDLSGVGYCVLDEADTMLKIGFAEEVEALFGGLPASRQTQLWSATLPGWVSSVASRFLSSPVSVDLVGDSQVSSLPSSVTHVGVPCPRGPGGMAEVLTSVLGVYLSGRETMTKSRDGPFSRSPGTPPSLSCNKESNKLFKKQNKTKNV